MEIHIGNYLDSNNYTNWSTSGLLQYLVEKENYTTEDATIFIMLFAVQEQDQRAQNQEYQWAQRQQDQRIQPQLADTQVFEVHSTILYARSSFFQEVLSTNKVEYEISIPD
ncbi:12175_t:CDS:2, partial [Rhizophagus irregularis]